MQRNKNTLRIPDAVEASTTGLSFDCGRPALLEGILPPEMSVRISSRDAVTVFYGLEHILSQDVVA